MMTESTDDLVFLQRDPVGRNHLELKKDTLWPKILDRALNDDSHQDSIRQQQDGMEAGDLDRRHWRR